MPPDLGQLYDEHAAALFAFVLNLTRNEADTRDVLQEVFLKLWTNAAHFDATRGSLRTWLLTAVRNRSIDHLRGRGAHERSEKELPESAPAAGPGADPWREVSLSMERDAVRQAMDSLPSEQKQAVELAYFGGYSYPEIAEMIRVPLSTVKGRMRLGMEKLHSYLLGKGFVYD